MLIATAPTTERLQMLARQYFYSDVTVAGDALIKSSGEPLNGFKVVKKGKQYRLESLA